MVETLSKKRWWKQRDAGLCGHDGCTDPPLPKRARCAKHARYKALAGKREYAQRVLNGLCWCGQLIEPKRTLCTEHRLELNRKIRRKQYNMTEVELAALETLADGHCMVCEIDAPLVIDHNHETGYVRGLLCNPCNVALGYLRKLETNMERVNKYLGQEEKQNDSYSE